MLLDNFFVFPYAVKRSDAKETIKLNTCGNTLRFYHNGKLNIIDTNLLRNGSSTVVINNPITGNTYVLYNFREILQAMDMMPQEFLSSLNQRCFMQIDKSDNKVFIKAFLFEDMNDLPSDTDDFSCFKHVSMDYIHDLDRDFSWTVINMKGTLEDGFLHLSFEVKRSEFWKELIFISHAGQNIPVTEGLNHVMFKYIPTELAYFGAKNCRYTGRSIDLNKLLGGN